MTRFMKNGVNEKIILTPVSGEPLTGILQFLKAKNYSEQWKKKYKNTKRKIREWRKKDWDSFEYL